MRNEIGKGREEIYCVEKTKGRKVFWKNKNKKGVDGVERKDRDFLYMRKRTKTKNKGKLLKTKT